MSTVNEGSSVELNQLLAQQAELTQKIETLRREAREQAIAEVRKHIALYAIGPAELGFGKPTKVTPESRKATPKYRDPATGATWSGRGKAPKWIADKDRNWFLIE